MQQSSCVRVLQQLVHNMSMCRQSVCTAMLGRRSEKACMSEVPVWEGCSEILGSVGMSGEANVATNVRRGHCGNVRSGQRGNVRRRHCDNDCQEGTMWQCQERHCRNARRDTDTMSGESCARHQQQAGTGSACQASTGRHQRTLQGLGVTELQGRGCLNLSSFQLSTGPDAGSLCSLRYFCTGGHLRGTGQQPAASEAKHHILQQQECPSPRSPDTWQANASRLHLKTKSISAAAKLPMQQV